MPAAQPSRGRANRSEIRVLTSHRFSQNGVAAMQRPKLTLWRCRIYRTDAKAPIKAHNLVTCMAGSSKHRPQLSEIGSGEFELTKVSSNCIAITNANHCSNWLYGLNDSASNLIFVEPGDGGRIASL